MLEERIAKVEKEKALIEKIDNIVCTIFITTLFSIAAALTILI